MEKLLMKQLSQNHELVYEILQALPIKIAFTHEGIVRFDTFDKSNSAFSFNIQTLTYMDYRSNQSGNILDLISLLSNKEKSLVCTELYMNLVTKGCIMSYEYVDKSSTYEFLYPEAYDESELEIYPPVISSLFKEDGLGIATQIYWGIRYDSKSKRVIIPVYQDCELVGAIGRLNKIDLEDWENKYFPILKYQKSRVLFGYDEYNDLLKKTKKVIIVESEKSVMKAWQNRSKIPVLAIGCSNISRHHIERLNLLGIEKIILALDKGIENPDVLTNNLHKLKTYSTAKTIQYIDSDNCEGLLMKECIFDRDIQSINKWFKCNLITYKEE